MGFTFGRRSRRIPLPDDKYFARALAHQNAELLAGTIFSLKHQWQGD